MDMPATRTPQHKPKREEQKAKELADLKRENTQLKRKVARLEKMLAKYQTLVTDVPVEVEEEEVRQSAKDECTKCHGTELAELAANNKVYVVCKNQDCLNRWTR